MGGEVRDDETGGSRREIKRERIGREERGKVKSKLEGKEKEKGRARTGGEGERKEARRREEQNKWQRLRLTCCVPPLN